MVKVFVSMLHCDRVVTPLVSATRRTQIRFVFVVSGLGRGTLEMIGTKRCAKTSGVVNQKTNMLNERQEVKSRLGASVRICMCVFANSFRVFECLRSRSCTPAGDMQLSSACVRVILWRFLARAGQMNVKEIL